MPHNNAENDQTREEMEKSIQSLRELVASYEAALDDEKNHIAREVHDELGQTLTALRMNVSLLRIQFGDGNPLLMEKIRNITELVDHAIQGVRNITSRLRPAALNAGTVSALQWLSEEFTRHTAITCSVETDNGNVELDEVRSAAIFRIVQESLTNVARHAEATCVKVFMARQGNNLLVKVHDNGTGFDPAAQACKGSFGLTGMQERAMALGGNFDVVSSRGQGTTISVCIPVAPAPWAFDNR